MAHRKLGEIALLRGETSSAIRSFTRAIGPNHQQWNYFLSVAFEREGSLHSFRTSMAKALERDPQKNLLRDFDFINEGERFYFIALASMVNQEPSKAIYFFNRYLATNNNRWNNRVKSHVKNLKEHSDQNNVHVKAILPSQVKTIETHLRKRLSDYKNCLQNLPDLYLDIQLEKIKNKREEKDLNMANDHRIRIVQTETTTATLTEVNQAKSCVYKKILPDYELIEKHPFKTARFSVFGAPQKQPKSPAIP